MKRLVVARRGCVGTPSSFITSSASFSSFNSWTPVSSSSSSYNTTVRTVHSTPATQQAAQQASTTSIPKPTLNFDDSKSAFKPLSTADLARALFVFKLCSFQFLVKNSKALLATSDKILGKGLTKWFLKKTFFGHFCAGETAEELLPVVDKLKNNGIGSILDYAAESDIPQQKPPQQAATPADPPQTVDPKDEKFLSERREGVVSARVYFYDNETACDNNAKIFMHCIEDAGRRTEGFAAIKVTALGNPELLMRISQILVESRKLFRQFAANDDKAAAAASVDGQPCIGGSIITKPNFIKALEMLNVQMSNSEIDQLFRKMDTDGNDYVDYIEWLESLQPNEPDLRPFFVSGKNPKEKSLLPTLNEDEIYQMDSMVVRLDKLAQEAAKRKVRLMVDAEHTYFQPAIDHMVLNLQDKYNKDFPSIYNTYQCYLLDTQSRVRVDLERARRKNYWFAAKLVRGAYMVQERKRAKELNYKDPIQPNIQATHQNYHEVLDMVLKNIQKSNVMVASHNEKTVRFAIEKMAEYGIPSKGGVYFGQLLGMCDHVSLTLGANNYSVYKYVPYGPVHEVVPYLIRRAEENSDILGGVQKERAMLWNEFKRRVNPLASK